VEEASSTSHSSSSSSSSSRGKASLCQALCRLVPQQSRRSRRSQPARRRQLQIITQEAASQEEAAGRLKAAQQQEQQPQESAGRQEASRQSESASQEESTSEEGLALAQMVVLGMPYDGYRRYATLPLKRGRSTSAEPTDAERDASLDPATARAVSASVHGAGGQRCSWMQHSRSWHGRHPVTRHERDQQVEPYSSRHQRLWEEQQALAVAYEPGTGPQPQPAACRPGNNSWPAAARGSRQPAASGSQQPAASSSSQQ
jgi:hypothetical protein